MLTSEGIAAVGAVQSHDAAGTVNELEVAMLRVVGKILSRGTYDVDDVEVLRSMAGHDADAGDRRFARGVIHWLAQQSATRPYAIWQRNGDAPQ